jgi:hypothetical protein
VTTPSSYQSLDTDLSNIKEPHSKKNLKPDILQFLILKNTHVGLIPYTRKFPTHDPDKYLIKFFEKHFSALTL